MTTKFFTINGKILFFALVLSIASNIIMAQAPQKMSYQAVIRNNYGALAYNSKVKIQISILYKEMEGKPIYTETHYITTNKNGLVSLEIGTGVSTGSFPKIEWGEGPFFLQTQTQILDSKLSSDEKEIEPYIITGVSELISVPYALYSNVAGKVTDPKLRIAKGITAQDTARWNSSQGLDTLVIYNETIHYDSLVISRYDTIAIDTLVIVNESTVFDSSFIFRYDTVVVSQIDTIVVNHVSEQNLADVLSTGNDAGAMQIKNLAVPTDAHDAVTKAYVDVLIDRIALLEEQLVLAAGVVDIDGNRYEVVKIADQIWMAQNLRVTRYADGTPIPYLPSAADWDTLSTQGKAYCYYDTTASGYGHYTKENFGALYSWAAATRNQSTDSSIIQGICPDGWHVPNYGEWFGLKNFIKDDGHPNTVAQTLRVPGVWYDNPVATNEYGFSAYPAGFRKTNGDFDYLSKSARFWSTFQHALQPEQGMTMNISYASEIFGYGGVDKNYGQSVRCVKD